MRRIRSLLNSEVKENVKNIIKILEEDPTKFKTLKELISIKFFLFFRYVRYVKISITEISRKKKEKQVPEKMIKVVLVNSFFHKKYSPVLLFPTYGNYIKIEKEIRIDANQLICYLQHKKILSRLRGLFNFKKRRKNGKT
ncbi:MAG: hypothetical protein PHE43_01045 [Candidatus Nanoarchaeia archaeon]|nr:hypothetical protein [Candidatus Nanoarchaeia archaeon]